ncbi:hypothetical protein CR513_30307, partial [Mucuna pruriens]
MRIGTTLSLEEEARLVNSLKQNMDVFAWSTRDMPGIDPSGLEKEETRRGEIERHQGGSEQIVGDRFHLGGAIPDLAGDKQ